MSQNFISLSPLCEKFDIEQMLQNWKFCLKSFKLHVRADNIIGWWQKSSSIAGSGRSICAELQTVFYAIAVSNFDKKTFEESIALMQNSSESLIYTKVYFLL